MAPLATSRPRVEIEAPPISMAPFGLFTVAQVIDMPDGPWQIGGIQYPSNSLCGTHPWLWPAPCEGLEGVDVAAGKQRDGGPAWVYGEPFIVYATAECSPGAGFAETAKPLAQRRLAAGEQCTVEAVLWKQLAGRAKDMLKLEESGLALGDGLRRLEWMATVAIGGTPVLHVPRGAAWCLSDNHSLWRDGPYLKTVLGSPIVFGACYDPQIGPEGDPFTPPDASEHAAYATGPVTILRGPVNTFETFDTQTNKHLVVAERVYLVTADCVQVSGVVCSCGGCDCDTSAKPGDATGGPLNQTAGGYLAPWSPPNPWKG